MDANNQSYYSLHQKISINERCKSIGKSKKRMSDEMVVAICYNNDSLQRYPRGGSSYSDIHDQEVLDSLSDRPLKGEGRLECQRASIIEFTRPDSTVPILGTSSAKVTEWVSRQSLKRTIGLEPPRSLARDFESRVSTISPPRHLESESYSMNMIPIQCDSCHIGPSRTSNCFDLNYPEDALYIIYIYISKIYLSNILLYQKDGQSNRFLDSIEAQRGE
ncbi:Exostosin family protein [Prunus dulcis]|uniref:Exostosin family protein n=2 Tax=Prunus dulcis TaxID=3755 RepID=A0A4Y1QZ42_PRUDU|nr:Exostosin family protein [Prunus dulcis]